MAKEYQPKKEPLIRGLREVGVFKDGIHKRILLETWPELKLFLTEQEITAGLGYKKIPHKNGLPREYDTQEDLTRHLAMMDAKVSSRNSGLNYYLSGNYFEKIVQIEDILLGEQLEKERVIEDVFGGISDGLREFECVEGVLARNAFHYISEAILKRIRARGVKKK